MNKFVSGGTEQVQLTAKLTLSMVLPLKFGVHIIQVSILYSNFYATLCIINIFVYTVYTVPY